MQLANGAAPAKLSIKPSSNPCTANFLLLFCSFFHRLSSQTNFFLQSSSSHDWLFSFFLDLGCAFEYLNRRCDLGITMASKTVGVQITDDELQVLQAYRDFKAQKSVQENPLFARRDFEVGLKYWRTEMRFESPVDLLPADDARLRHPLMKKLRARLRAKFEDPTIEFDGRQVAFMATIQLSSLEQLVQESRFLPYPIYLDELIQIGIYTHFIFMFRII